VHGRRGVHLDGRLPGGVRIDDADVRADERERVLLDGGPVAKAEDGRGEVDRWLVRVGETHPGVVAKLRAVWGDLDCDVPSGAPWPRWRGSCTRWPSLDARADAPLSRR
ncbi:MAG: hypothetical protein ACRDQF_10760, partial [Thermocrispum sp.]